SAIRPIQESVLEIEFQVDRLRQPIEEHLDVGPIGRGLALWDFDAGPKDAALAGIIRAFLRPIYLSAIRINGNAYAPLGLVVTGTRMALARVNQSLNLRTIDARAHDSHPFAIRPVELPVLLIKMELLWRERAAFGDDSLTILPAEVGALDVTIVFA